MLYVPGNSYGHASTLWNNLISNQQIVTPKICLKNSHPSKQLRLRMDGSTGTRTIFPGQLFLNYLPNELGPIAVLIKERKM